MRFEGVLLVRTPESDVSARHDERGTPFVGAGRPDRRVHRGYVHPVHLLHVPAIRREARADVLGEGDVGGRRERDAVRVVEHDQPAEMEVAGERRRFRSDAFHQVAIARDDPGAVVDDGLAGPIERGGEPSLRDRHPDRVSKPLAEGPGGNFDAGRDSPFGVTRRPAAPAPEVLQIVEGEPVPGQEQEAVQQHAAVSRREHEPVAVDPLRMSRVVAEVARPQNIGHGGRAHRQSRMSRCRLLDGIDAERADGVDAEIVEGASERSHRVLPRRDM